MNPIWRLRDGSELNAVKQAQVPAVEEHLALVGRSSVPRDVEESALAEPDGRRRPAIHPARFPLLMSRNHWDFFRASRGFKKLETADSFNKDAGMAQY